MEALLLVPLTVYAAVSYVTESAVIMARHQILTADIRLDFLVNSRSLIAFCNRTLSDLRGFFPTIAHQFQKKNQLRLLRVQLPNGALIEDQFNRKFLSTVISLESLLAKMSPSNCSVAYRAETALVFSHLPYH
jgi:hypothetical protein